MQANYHSTLDNLKDKLLKMVELKDNPWTFEIEKSGFKAYSQYNIENGLKINRLETTQNINGEEFISLIYDVEKRKAFDECQEELKIVENIDDFTQIIFWKGKKLMVFVAPRDLLIVNKRYSLPDGRIMIVSKSIDRSDIPVDSGRIRSEMLFYGCIVSKIDEKLTNIVTISNTDPKGSIPKFLINQSFRSEIDQLSKAVQFLQSRQQKQQQQK